MTTFRQSLGRLAAPVIAFAALIAAPAPALASVCTLADHIRSANTNTAVGYCPAGDEPRHHHHRRGCHADGAVAADHGHDHD